MNGGENPEVNFDKRIDKKLKNMRKILMIYIFVN